MFLDNQENIRFSETAFTTERKHKKKTCIDILRKGSIVKERCRQLAEIALEFSQGRRIKHEDLLYLINRYIGGDKETVRAYMGYYGTIKRSKRTGEGYVIGKSRKVISKFSILCIESVIMNGLSMLR